MECFKWRDVNCTSDEEEVEQEVEQEVEEEEEEVRATFTETERGKTH